MEAVRKMKTCPRTIMLLLPACCLSLAPTAFAQTTVQLFGPVDVRPSQSNASYATPVTFNSTTVSLSCPASATASLSGTNTGTGKVLVDNNLFISINNGNQVDVCPSGIADDGFNDCFTSSYQNAASELTGLDPDTADYPGTTTAIISTGGVAALPIDISSYLIQGAAGAPQQQQLTVSLVDSGGYVASSSIYLTTNCTVGGVQGQGTITGNPIPSSNPSQSQLNQDFDFNTNTDQVIGFSYDLSGAYSANTLTTQDQTIPSTNDTAIIPSGANSYQTLTQGTSFSTSSCLIHNGELLNGTSVCKLFTLVCSIGTGASGTGANCPVSSQPNESFQDTFDGPTFTLPSITNSNGTTYHEGMAFLMAAEGWHAGSGGPCEFDSSETELASKLCPLNILVGFSGPGTFSTNGQSTRPNSEFITAEGVPEDLTTVTPTDSEGNPISLGPGNWTNSKDPNIVLSSQPPNFTGMSEGTLPGVSHFVAAPIQSITWGITPGTTAPTPGTTSDQNVDDAAGCPSPEDPTTPPAATFATAPQDLGITSDGQYLIHYYATDCAGTKELQFLNTAANGSGTWSTNYYTYPVNVDTVPPKVPSLTLSPAGPYYLGEKLMATFDCTDDRSGVVSCGGQSFSVGTLDTGSITTSVTASSAGSFSVTAIDAAGNQYTASTSYVDSQIVLTLASGTITYPLGTNLVVQVTNINKHVPTGTVQILNNGAVLTTLSLSSGAAYYYVKNLPAGMHTLNAVYSGDKYNSSGTSAPVTLNVLPVPVTMSPACWNSPYAYGANFECVVSTSSTAGAPQGYITYSVDGGVPQNLTLSSGKATIVVTKPVVGGHSLVISYPAQTNYAAAGPQTVNFTVTPAPVYVKLTPSSWSLKAGYLTLTAAVQSWSAGAPNGIGSVTFNVPGNAAVTVPVNSSGVAIDSGIVVTSIPNGSESISATYSGTNYATSTTTISVQVNHP